jgi:CBS domain containing-hemolysin-like protein
MVAVAFLVVFGSVLAMAEASLTRISAHRARALVAEGRRNARLVERIQNDPPRYLNSVYLAVMFAQNGSAILVAILADRTFGDVGITITSIGFTLLYFISVEAMSKTFGVLNSDRVATAIAPFVVGLSRVFAPPVWLLIGLSNVLLPGKGLKQGPFVSAEDIRQLTDVGVEAGSIGSDEKDLIFSALELRDTLARDVMVPRPDMDVVSAGESARTAIDIMVAAGHSRLPVHGSGPDDIVGILYLKDIVRVLDDDRGADITAGVLARAPHFVPETARLAELLRDMQRLRVQMAIVTDEHGDVAGLLTMEDIIEEIVGDISDEDDLDDVPLEEISPGIWRVQAKMRIRDFNDLAGASLAESIEWQTIGGLVSAILAKIPEPGDETESGGFIFHVEGTKGPRIGMVTIRQTNPAG